MSNGMNHPNWDRAERECLERRSGQDREDEEDEICNGCDERNYNCQCEKEEK